MPGVLRLDQEVSRVNRSPGPGVAIRRPHRQAAAGRLHADQASDSSLNFVIDALLLEQSRNDLLADVTEINERKEGAGRLLEAAIRVAIQVIQPARQLKGRPGCELELKPFGSLEHSAGHNDFGWLIRGGNG